MLLPGSRSAPETFRMRHQSIGFDTNVEDRRVNCLFGVIFRLVRLRVALQLDGFFVELQRLLGDA